MLLDWLLYIYLSQLVRVGFFLFCFLKQEKHRNIKFSDAFLTWGKPGKHSFQL